MIDQYYKVRSSILEKVRSFEISPIIAKKVVNILSSENQYKTISIIIWTIGSVWIISSVGLYSFMDYTSSFISNILSSDFSSSCWIWFDANDVEDVCSLLKSSEQKIKRFIEFLPYWKNIVEILLSLWFGAFCIRLILEFLNKCIDVEKWSSLNEK